MKKITIVFKKSKRTGKWYWRMKGNNNEKMGNSPPMKSLQWAKELASDFAKRGYKVIWELKLKKP